MDTLHQLKINKKLLKQDILTTLRQFYPDVRQHLTKKSVREMMIFIEGYEVCLRSFIQAPVIEKDIYDCLKEEALKFLYKSIKTELM